MEVNRPSYVKELYHQVSIQLLGVTAMKSKDRWVILYFVSFIQRNHIHSTLVFLRLILPKIFLIWADDINRQQNAIRHYNTQIKIMWFFYLEENISIADFRKLAKKFSLVDCNC